MSTIRVEIEPEVELYPVLSILDSPLADDEDGYDIPRELWDDLCRAQVVVDAAEVAIMRYVAANYPDASDVRSWLRENGAEAEDAA